ncbi:hypothetical protein SAMD00023353_2700320 [Rosellinia necatrix]|uniref:2EXR domain-containing protein n=1 Tax=Rosellinia necatrix TaxID=77044 RepID=A0A1W2TGX4_ROSNE|nr:hypothetical protein SAMD00023353_2700320 [Rosellinia necatrix]
MPPDHFPQFVLLPLELRMMIYQFASPARFVHVQEDHEDPDEFEERFRTTPVQLRLHPSVTYFARHWRHRIPWAPAAWRPYYRRQQMTLDMYGLRCPRQRHQPWESADGVPDIPHHFLSENPDVAWEFVRSGSFYSTAPIPALLHVSRESRHILMGHGYELAFRTRTCGPRTWFNFKTDVLYLGEFELGEMDRPLHRLLSGNTKWDVGQFDPSDLKRVRRVALESSAKILICDLTNWARQLSNLLELFAGLEELFIEEGMRVSPTTEFGRAARADGPFWTYTPAEEVDVLYTMVEHEDLVHFTGFAHEGLRAYKTANMGDGSRFFIDAALRFEEQLAAIRDETVQREALAPWKIPKVSIVHIGHPWMIRALFEQRWSTWNSFQFRKEENARAKAIEEARRSIDVPKKHLYHLPDLPPSPFSRQFRDELEVYHASLEAYIYSEYDWERRSDYHHWMFSEGMRLPDVRRLAFHPTSAQQPW